MVIIETSIFTKQVLALLEREEYRMLQLELVSRPDAGDIIPRSGGLRKIRWRAKGKGKRGGVRVIYYWVVSQDQILMLLAYSKTTQDNLTAKQLNVLRQIIEEEYP